MLTKIQALIAPLAAPVAPALLLGNEMYQVMVLVGINAWLAFVCAFVAIVGLEFSGALASTMAVKSWKRRSWGALTLSVIGTLVYAGIVFGGIRMMPQARAQVFGVMVLVSLVAYLGYALYQNYHEQDTQHAEQTEQQIELVRQQKQFLNAQTRQLQWQAQTGFVPGADIVRSGGERGERLNDLSKQLDVWSYLDTNGDSGPSEIARVLGISKSTAQKHIQSWKAKQ